ncbi:MAG: nucleotidyltransferase family protein [Candidatus Omnitrophota bacterium]|nr:nucleotidyltransferase family protein [Candidatus Omnitrophota bacterium]MDZ4242828.1 nucleotidyltransferase family protein [Candidatus Omnitrophota bacterium]
MISCVLLSAGLSSRFGSPKALAPWIGGQTVIGHLQSLLLSSSIDEIIVVVGAGAENVRPHVLKHKKIRIVYNKDYILGQTSSFRAALPHCSPAAEAVFLLPVDFPAIQCGTLQSLIAAFHQQKPLILVPVHEGRRGHPPLFRADLLSEFLALGDDCGINSVLHRYETDVVDFSVNDEGVLVTFNTPEEFRQIRERAAPEGPAGTK